MVFSANLECVTELENAIACYETTTGLPVVVHDLTHQLWRELALTQFRHGHAACQCIKQGPSGARCIHFETVAFRQDAERWRQGRLHRCHAGFTELAMPVFDRKKLMFVLFTGPVTIADTRDLDYLAPRSGASTTTRGSVALPQLRSAQIPILREQLTQLGTRLRCWVRDQGVSTAQASMPRQARITRYIEGHYQDPIKLVDLAERLNLSIDRTRHLIKEECGENFSTLLTRTRLQAASSLLLNTDMPVGRIAERCGIPDPSGFNRSFKKAFGCAPLKWRKKHRG